MAEACHLVHPGAALPRIVGRPRRAQRRRRHNVIIRGERHERGSGGGAVRREAGGLIPPEGPGGNVGGEELRLEKVVGDLVTEGIGGGVLEGTRDLRDGGDRGGGGHTWGGSTGRY